MSESNDTLTLAESTRQIIDKWLGTTLSLISAITSFFTALSIPSSWAKAMATLIAIAFSLLCLKLFIGARRKANSLSKIKLERDTPTSESAAFRGLRRFTKGETLPGQYRRNIAQALLKQVKDQAADLTVVTGSSGAGKSSLLEAALLEPLESEGYVVQLFRDLTSIANAESQHEDNKADDARRLWNAIYRRVSDNLEESITGVIIIIDQFEELLTTFATENGRRQLGSVLDDARKEGWRIVIGIRKEYFTDLKEVLSTFPQGANLDNTFIVKNFSREEACDVINECASRDLIEIDSDLPSMIAADLSGDGSVRPPDLQIICDAMRRDLTVGNYRRAGGAAGLRSRFVEDNVDFAGRSVLVRWILRELCDFQNNKKNSDPPNVTQMFQKSLVSTPGPKTTLQEVEACLLNLEKSYIVIRINHGSNEHWGLIHDYMVEPIRLVTEKMATESDAAVSELNYYVSKSSADGTTLIPLTRLSFIRRSVPPSLLETSAVRRLVRKSALYGYGRPATLIALATLVSAGSVVALTSKRNVWKVVSSAVIAVSRHSDTAHRLARRSFTAKYLDQANTTTLVVSESYEGGDASIWAANDGTEVAHYSGNLSMPKVLSGHVWEYSSETGMLTRWDGHANPSLVVSTTENRPRGLPLKVVEEFLSNGTPKVILEPSELGKRSSLIEAVFDLGAKSWTTIDENDIYPADTKDFGSSSERRSSDEFTVDVVSVSGASESGVTRVTVWLKDRSKRVIDETIPTDDIHLLGFSRSGEIRQLSLITKDRLVLTYRLSYEVDYRTKELGARFLGRVATALPADFKWPLGNSGFFFIGNNRDIEICTAGNSFLLAERRLGQSAIWKFDPVTNLFSNPVVSNRVIPRPANGKDLVWSSSETSESVSLWRSDRSMAIRTQIPSIMSTDVITTTLDYSRALVVHDNKTAELWDITEGSSKKLPLAQIVIPDLTEVSFGLDQQIVFARQLGGGLYGWTIDGDFLGTLGTIGSSIIASNFQKHCGRLILWTGEGQEVDLRRGTDIPIYGFVPANACGIEHKNGSIQKSGAAVGTLSVGNTGRHDPG